MQDWKIMKKIKNLIYIVLDLLLFGKGIPRRINNFNVRFPVKWSRYFESNYEKENVDFLKTVVLPGSIVIDVGAHLGLMSIICSKLSGPNGRVYSFEPSPDTQKACRKIISLNSGTAPIYLRTEAISDHTGEINFYFSKDEGSNSNSLVQKHDLARESIIVKCLTLDAFVSEQKLERVDVIKIDAEGSELNVLRGAEKTLVQFRPKMVLAIHPRLILNNGQDPSELFYFLSKLNYQIIHQGEVVDETLFNKKTDFFDLHLIPMYNG